MHVSLHFLARPFDFSAAGVRARAHRAGMARVSAALSFIVLVGASFEAVANNPCGSGSYPFPFTDVASVGDAFCPGIMEAYVVGVTKGTTGTTFSPNDPVPRVQMTTFLQRSLDQGLKRNNRRAALDQWSTPKTSTGLQAVPLSGSGSALFCKSDGEHIWVGNGDTVNSVHSATGEPHAAVETSFSAPYTAVGGILVARGQVWAIDSQSPALIFIRPGTQPPFWLAAGAVDLVAHPVALAFDGDRIWTANLADSSVSIIPINANRFPDVAGTITVAGFTSPNGLQFDGTNMWVTDFSTSKLHKLNANGSIAQSVTVGTGPTRPAYDGTNIWVPSFSANSITVVQASTGAVVATIATNASNRLSQPAQATFDGERILVTNPGNNSVTLFRAADLSLIGNVQLAAGSAPFGACSDGINFWVVLSGSQQLLRL